jgi:hypothetical protein
MGEENKIIGTLKKLVALSPTSPYIYTTTVDLLCQVFSTTKPLFSSQQERTEAGDLLKRSLPRLESSLVQFHGSLNVDLRQTAQRVRSGLQFLVDKLKDDASADDDVQNILKSDAVKCIEEYIANTKGIPPEFTPPEPEDLSKVPPSHVWWAEEKDDSE